MEADTGAADAGTHSTAGPNKDPSSASSLDHSSEDGLDAADPSVDSANRDASPDSCQRHSPSPVPEQRFSLSPSPEHRRSISSIPRRFRGSAQVSPPSAVRQRRSLSRSDSPPASQQALSPDPSVRQTSNGQQAGSQRDQQASRDRGFRASRSTSREGRSSSVSGDSRGGQPRQGMSSLSSSDSDHSESSSDRSAPQHHRAKRQASRDDRMGNVHGHRHGHRSKRRPDCRSQHRQRESPDHQAAYRRRAWRARAYISQRPRRHSRSRSRNRSGGASPSHGRRRTHRHHAYSSGQGGDPSNSKSPRGLSRSPSRSPPSADRACRPRSRFPSPTADKRPAMRWWRKRKRTLAPRDRVSASRSVSEGRGAVSHSRHSSHPSGSPPKEGPSSPACNPSQSPWARPRPAKRRRAQAPSRNCSLSPLEGRAWRMPPDTSSDDKSASDGRSSSDGSSSEHSRSSSPSASPSPRLPSQADDALLMRDPRSSSQARRAWKYSPVPSLSWSHDSPATGTWREKSATPPRTASLPPSASPVPRRDSFTASPSPHRGGSNSDVSPSRHARRSQRSSSRSRSRSWGRRHLQGRSFSRPADGTPSRSGRFTSPSPRRRSDADFSSPERSARSRSRPSMPGASPMASQDHGSPGDRSSPEQSISVPSRRDSLSTSPSPRAGKPDRDASPGRLKRSSSTSRSPSSSPSHGGTWSRSADGTSCSGRSASPSPRQHSDADYSSPERPARSRLRPSMPCASPNPSQDHGNPADRSSPERSISATSRRDSLSPSPSPHWGRHDSDASPPMPIRSSSKSGRALVPHSPALSAGAHGNAAARSWSQRSCHPPCRDDSHDSPSPGRNSPELAARRQHWSSSRGPSSMPAWHSVLASDEGSAAMRSYREHWGYASSSPSPRWASHEGDDIRPSRSFTRSFSGGQSPMPSPPEDEDRAAIRRLREHWARASPAADHPLGPFKMEGLQRRTPFDAGHAASPPQYSPCLPSTALITPRTHVALPHMILADTLPLAARAKCMTTHWAVAAAVQPPLTHLLPHSIALLSQGTVPPPQRTALLPLHTPPPHNSGLPLLITAPPLHHTAPLPRPTPPPHITGRPLLTTAPPPQRTAQFPQCIAPQSQSTAQPLPGTAFRTLLGDNAALCPPLQATSLHHQLTVQLLPSMSSERPSLTSLVWLLATLCQDTRSRSGLWHRRRDMPCSQDVWPAAGQGNQQTLASWRLNLSRTGFSNHSPTSCHPAAPILVCEVSH